MSGFDHRERMERARRAMAGAGVDVMLVSVGFDLPYLTGYEAMPLERLTMLVLPLAGDATLVVPELEAPRVDAGDDLFEVRPWGELEDPVAIVADLAAGREVAAIGDQTWAVFLLRLQEALEGVRFRSATPLTTGLRMRKDAEELSRLRLAGAALDRVVARIPSIRFAGSTEREVGRQIAEWTVAEGHDAATFTIVAAGPNSASPHHETGDRTIEAGDTVVVDFGGSWGGYQSDSTRTFHVGEPSADVQEAFAVLSSAQQAAVEAVRPGVEAQTVDAAARRIITEAGYGNRFIHRTGHGIGLDVHEDPYIVEGNTLELEPSMTFSVEPGIYVPGRFGMRIEDIVCVTDDGVERFNRSPRDLAIVE